MKGGGGCGRHGGAEPPSRKDSLPIQARPQLLRAPHPWPPLLGGPCLVAELGWGCVRFKDLAILAPGRTLSWTRLMPQLSPPGWLSLCQACIST